MWKQWRPFSWVVNLQLWISFQSGFARFQLAYLLDKSQFLYMFIICLWFAYGPMFIKWMINDIMILTSSNKILTGKHFYYTIFILIDKILSSNSYILTIWHTVYYHWLTSAAKYRQIERSPIGLIRNTLYIFFVSILRLTEWASCRVLALRPSPASCCGKSKHRSHIYTANQAHPWELRQSQEFTCTPPSYHNMYLYMYFFDTVLTVIYIL